MAEPYDAYRLYFRADCDGQGWNETYYMPHEADAGTVLLNLLSLRDARLQALNVHFRYIYGQVSQIDVAGDVIVTDCTPLPGSRNVPALPTNTAIEVRFLSTNQRSSVRLIRGLDVELLNAEGCVDNTSASYDAVDSFATYLDEAVSLGWGLINFDITRRFPKFTFDKYITHCVGEVRSRDTGRPFGLRRGRASKRKPVPPPS